MPSSDTKLHIVPRIVGKTHGTTRNGAHYRKIVTMTNCSCGTVKWQQQTGTVVSRRITVMKQIITQWQDQIIAQIPSSEKRKTSRQISACLEEYHGTLAFVSKIQRGLMEVDLKAYRARKERRLTGMHRQEWIQLALKHRHWQRHSEQSGHQRWIAVNPA